MLLWAIDVKASRWIAARGRTNSCARAKLRHRESNKRKFSGRARHRGVKSTCSMRLAENSAIFSTELARESWIETGNGRPITRARPNYDESKATNLKHILWPVLIRVKTGRPRMKIFLTGLLPTDGWRRWHCYCYHFVSQSTSFKIRTDQWELKDLNPSKHWT